MAGRLPGPDGATRSALVDRGTHGKIESVPYRPADGACGDAARDELTPIARYMATEMNVNAAGSDVLSMREMNAYDPTACVSDFNRLPMWKQILGLGVTPQQCVEQGMTYSAAALLSLIWSALVEPHGATAVATAGWITWGDVAWAALVASLLGHSLFFKLVQKHPVAQVAPYLLMAPIVGILLGVFVWGDRPGPRLWIGGAMVLGGVLAIALRTLAKQRIVSPEPTEI